VDSYGQYCPVAKAAEIVAERWTPLILRELLADSHHFNELQRGLPMIPRSILAQRLRRLEAVGVVDRRVGSGGRATSYHLTAGGRELQGAIDALGEWGARWVLGDPDPRELDPALLLWRMRRRINHDRLPDRRTVVQFDFRGARTGSYWLIIEPDDVSVCLHDPGFDVDVLVSTDIAAFHRVWLGRTSLLDALSDESIRLEGKPSFTRAFGSWFAWSPFAETVRTGRVAWSRNGSLAPNAPVNHADQL
jgi:DNA-binding HxlR family transcriptional regulator